MDTSFNSLRTLAMTIAVGMLGATSAVASTVGFSGTASGTWHNADGTGVTVIGSHVVEWGTPPSGDNNPTSNSWTFAGGSWSADADSPFRLGDFTYQNGTVLADSHDFEGADLNVSLSIEGVSTVDFSFGFDVFNTPNQCSGDNCSDDIASIENVLSDQVFEYEGKTYTLMLLGFSQNGGSDLLLDFEVPEYDTLTAGLYGAIVPASAPVPLPAAGWMLLAALGGLGLMRRGRGRNRA